MLDIPTRKQRWHTGRPRRGAMLVMVAVTLVILLVAAAFSVDVAYMFLVREELHIATDAAAKAAVAGLSQGGNSTAATNAAINCAAANTVGGKALAIDASNVTLGGVAYSDTGYWTFSAGGNPLTAARVTVNMNDGTTAGSVSLFFGRLFGTPKFFPTTTSTAAFVRNKVSLCFDRSHSMCFDLSGVDWVYPPRTPALKKNQDPYDYPPAPVGSRWACLAAGANVFLDIVNANTIQQTPVSLITWADSATTDATFTTANNYSTIRTAITNLGNNKMWGGTNMGSGMQQAVNLFASNNDGLPWNKIIILFSDGQWNAGTDPMTFAQTAANAGIVIHTVGLLSSGDNGTMKNIAAKTGGLYFYAPDAASLQTAFEKLARTLPVILTQ